MLNAQSSKLKVQGQQALFAIYVAVLAENDMNAIRTIP